MSKSLFAALSLVCVASFASAANADTINTYGEVTQDASGYTLTSDTSGPPHQGYAGLYYDYTASPITAAAITNLSANYQMLEGTFGGGAPRFSIIDTTDDSDNHPNEAYVYWGTPLSGGSFTDPNAGSGSPKPTGNYADILSTDLRVQVNGFNGDFSGLPYITWADFLARDGLAGIDYITLDLDGGFTGTQQMLVTDFNVTTAAASATPLPAALPMFGGALGLAGGYFGWRRKRKAIAAA